MQLPPLPPRRALFSGSFSGSTVSAAIRRMGSGCCARAASGHAATPPPTTVMNSRRLMGFVPQAEDHTLAYRRAREGVVHRRKMSSPCRRWVKTGVYRTATFMPALPRSADIGGSSFTGVRLATPGMGVSARPRHFQGDRARQVTARALPQARESFGKQADARGFMALLGRHWKSTYGTKSQAAQKRGYLGVSAPRLMRPIERLLPAPPTTISSAGKVCRM